MSSEACSDDELRRSVRRAMRSSGLVVASLMYVWERAFPHEDLATSLGCTERAVLELGMCLRPRPEYWGVDVAEIANSLALEGTSLEAFFRKAEVLERLALAHPVDDCVGQLMAARDRSEDD